MKLSLIKQSSRQKILIYGKPKSGKTRLAGSLAKAYKLKWIDGENGVSTLMQASNLSPELMERIDVLQLPDMKEYPVMVQTVLKILTGGAIRACGLHGVNQCPSCLKLSGADWFEIELNKQPADEFCVFDSWTQFDFSARNQRLRQIFPKPKEIDDSYKFDWDDWAWLKNVHERAGSYIQSIDANIVVISHEQLTKLEDKTELLVPVAGSENSSKTFTKYFDTVIYCQVMNNKHKAGSGTTYTMSAVTGSRMNMKIEGLSEPDLALAIQDAVKQGERK